MKIKISPSLMCMDLLRFKEQLTFLDSHADFLHIDIMDGHYVPNLTLSPFFMESVAKVSKLPMDCHLMTTDPWMWVPIMAKAGAGFISPQAETINAIAFRIIAKIRELGCKPGIVVNPATPLDSLRHYIHLIDKITIMTVDPGYAGQPFIEEMLDKITEAKRLREERGLNFLIEVDGSCNKRTYARLAAAGADVFIVGTSGLFHNHEDIAEAWKIMAADIEAALGAAA